MPNKERIILAKEDEERLRLLREAGERIADAALELKKTADKLRDDVNELTKRVTVGEEERDVQNERLDSLEK